MQSSMKMTKGLHLTSPYLILIYPINVTVFFIYFFFLRNYVILCIYVQAAITS